MAENFPPHPKVNRSKPRSQSIFLHRYLWSQVLSQVSQENLQPFTGLSGLRWPGKRSIRCSQPPHHFPLVLTFFFVQQLDETGNRQATVLANLSSSPYS